VLTSTQHIMVEKPIAVDVETTRQVVQAAKEKPHLKFLVPFCRRCACTSLCQALHHSSRCVMQSTTRTAG
jgi:hypothetical protein